MHIYENIESIHQVDDFQYQTHFTENKATDHIH